MYLCEVSNSVNPYYVYKPDDKVDVPQLYQQLITGDRLALAKAITLIESTLKEHVPLKTQLLKCCAAQPTKSVRIGLTGVPGAGKSTLTEALGNYIIQQGFKLAVLAIDPSSSRSKGSILGDKTRMQTLSNNPQAYIRPTASGGHLGGVAHYTKEVISLCEAAGYDMVIVETVGVGQSETLVHELTDLFLLLAVAGTGDELQGIKRGIMEMGDIVVVNKSDGDNITRSRQAATQLKNAMHLFPVEEGHWIPQVLNVSALEQKGIDELYQCIQKFVRHTQAKGQFEWKRKQQEKNWLNIYIDQLLKLDALNSVTEEAFESLKEEALQQHPHALEAAIEVIRILQKR